MRSDADAYCLCRVTALLICGSISSVYPLELPSRELPLERELMDELIDREVNSVDRVDRALPGRLRSPTGRGEVCK